MKWIKLFENFDNDALEDAKHIIISHLGEIEEDDFAGGEFPIAMPDRLKDRIRVYRLLESPNVRDLSGCEEHLEQETEGVFWNVNLDWYSGKIAVIGLGDSLESFLVEWLKERFCEAQKKVECGQEYIMYTVPKIFYREKNGSAVFYYCEGDEDKIAYVAYDKIWGFFKSTLGLEDRQIRNILRNWLLQEYNLDLEPKKW